MNQLQKDDQGFATVWLLSTLGVKSVYKKVAKRQIMMVSIPETCTDIQEQDIALRVSSNMLYGVSLVYRKKTEYFYSDASNVKTSLQRCALTKRQVVNVDHARGFNFYGNIVNSQTIFDSNANLLQDDPNFNINEGLLPDIGNLFGNTEQIRFEDDDRVLDPEYQDELNMDDYGIVLIDNDLQGTNDLDLGIDFSRVHEPSLLAENLLDIQEFPELDLEREINEMDQNEVTLSTEATLIEPIEPVRKKARYDKGPSAIKIDSIIGFSTAQLKENQNVYSNKEVVFNEPGTPRESLLPFFLQSWYDQVMASDWVNHPDNNLRGGSVVESVSDIEQGRRMSFRREHSIISQELQLPIDRNTPSDNGAPDADNGFIDFDLDLDIPPSGGILNTILSSPSREMDHWKLGQRKGSSSSKRVGRSSSFLNEPLLEQGESEDENEEILDSQASRFFGYLCERAEFIGTRNNDPIFKRTLLFEDVVPSLGSLPDQVNNSPVSKKLCATAFYSMLQLATKCKLKISTETRNDNYRILHGDEIIISI